MLDVKASMQLTIVTLGMSNLEPTKIFQESFFLIIWMGANLKMKAIPAVQDWKLFSLVFCNFFLICKKTYQTKKKSWNCFPMLRFSFGIHRPDYTMGSSAFWQTDCILSMAWPDPGLILWFGINTITRKSQRKFWVVKNGWDEHVQK